MHFLMHWGPVLINVNRPTKLQKRQSSQQAENNKMTTKWFKKCSSLLVGYKHLSELTGLSCTLNFFCVCKSSGNKFTNTFLYIQLDKYDPKHLRQVCNDLYMQFTICHTGSYKLTSLTFQLQSFNRDLQKHSWLIDHIWDKGEHCVNVICDQMIPWNNDMRLLQIHY